MLELYKSGFAFDSDDKYILLDNENCNKDIDLQQQLLQKDNGKIGLDIHIDETELDRKLIFPYNIKYLRFQCHSLHYDNLILPDTLEYIHLDISLYSFITNFKYKNLKLPKSLKHLSLIIDCQRFPKELLNMQVSSISKSINDLMKHIYNTQGENIINIEYLKVNFHLPNIEEFTNLKILILDGFHNYPLDNLPASLEWLEIHSLQFNQHLANLPPGLKVLIFGQNRILNYYDGYHHSLDGLPPSLEVLHFLECMSLDGKQYLANLMNLPPSLKILGIPRVMPDDMNYDCLPDTIEIIEWLEFRRCYTQVSRFPANLKKIRCHFDSNNDDEKEKIITHFENMPFTIEDY